MIPTARQPPEAADRAALEVELSIVLGPGAAAGVDCDLVIETGGNDPGAVIRSGSARNRPADDLGQCVCAPLACLFHAEGAIGDIVAPGDVLGFVGSTPALVPAAGRLRGLLRSGSRVDAGEAVAEITASRTVPVNIFDRTHQIIARSVAFTIELEQQGQSGEVWSRRTGFRSPP
jgi:xanthine dehydrogenase accessory factor